MHLNRITRCWKLFRLDPGWSQWDTEIHAWYIPCDTSNIEAISIPKNAANPVIFHYEGPTSFVVNGISGYHSNLWHHLDRFCVPQNHFYWASKTGTKKCVDVSDPLTTYSPMTLYIDLEWRAMLTHAWWYNGIVSAASIAYINISARAPTNEYRDEYTEEVILNLYWNRKVYKCSISLSNFTTSYSCDAADLLLLSSNCSESAFAVGLKYDDYDVGSLQIDFISVTDEDGNTKIMNETIFTNHSAIIVDLSSVWSEKTLDIYHRDLNTLCFVTTGLIVISTMILH